MKIAIISDIHDQVDNLKWALKEMKKREIDQVFALGDYCTPYVVERLGLVGVPVTAVWGNNDGDKVAMFKAVVEDQDNSISFKKRVFADVDLNGDKYFITHYPLLAENAALTEKYKAVFYGHTHKKRKEYLKDTLLVNPGKLALYPDSLVSFAIYDTKQNEVVFVEKK